MLSVPTGCPVLPQRSQPSSPWKIGHEALGEVGTSFKASADSWSGGVVGGDEEGTNCHNKNTHWFGEIGAHGTPIFWTENLILCAARKM